MQLWYKILASTDLSNKCSKFHPKWVNVETRKNIALSVFLFILWAWQILNQKQIWWRYEEESEKQGNVCLKSISCLRVESLFHSQFCCRCFSATTVQFLQQFNTFLSPALGEQSALDADKWKRSFCAFLSAEQWHNVHCVVCTLHNVHNVHWAVFTFSRLVMQWNREISCWSWHWPWNYFWFWADL